jgi:hypothetical protein
MGKERAAELSQWRDQVAKDLEQARQELVEVQKRVREGEQRLELVSGLLALEEGASSSAVEARPVSSSEDLLDACEQISREAGRPLHIRELHAALVERGVPLPGRGAEANLIVRLQRSEGRFVRVGRGLYAAASLGLSEVKPMRKRLRASKRR